MASLLTECCFIFFYSLEYILCNNITERVLNFKMKKVHGDLSSFVILPHKITAITDHNFHKIGHVNLIDFVYVDKL